MLSLKKIELLFVYILFLSIIVFPYGLYQIKIPILIFFLLNSIIIILAKRKISLPPTVFILFTINIFLGLFFIIYGILTGNSYSGSFIYMFSLYVVFPIVYALLIALIPKNIRSIKVAMNILFIGFISISLVMIIAYYLKKYDYNEILSDFGINVDLRTDVIRMRYHGISSLLFLFPLFFTYKLINKSDVSIKRFLVNIIAFTLSILAVFMSGRRALLILFFFSIIIAFLFKKSIKSKLTIKKSNLKVFLIAITVALSLVIYNSNKILNTVGATFSYVLDLTTTEFQKAEISERDKQIEPFLLNISKSPILGYGHGAAMEEIIRSEDKPWRYELSYLDLIFHTGIIGFILYCIAPLWIFLSLFKIAMKHSEHRALAFGLLNGFICVFIAFYSNPYLNAFDIQWVIYFPLLFIIIINKHTANVNRLDK